MLGRKVIPSTFYNEIYTTIPTDDFRLVVAEVEIRAAIKKVALTRGTRYIAIPVPDGVDVQDFREWLDTQEWLHGFTVHHFREDSTISWPD
jgi:hypothetical protein